MKSIQQQLMEIFGQPPFDEVDAEMLTQEFLDEKVQDLKLQEASDLNNDGIDAQIAYVRLFYKPDELIKQAKQS